MNRALLSYSVALSFFLVACSTNTIKDSAIDSSKIGQANESNGVQQEEREITYEYVVPKKISYYDGEGELVTGFFPIGWSRDGKFAYVSEPADEACGCYFFAITVQDMTTNKEAWKWEFNNEEEGKNKDLQAVWEENYVFFRKKLREFLIIQLTDLKLGDTTFTYKEREYFITHQSRTKDEHDFVVVDNLQVYLESPQLGRKRVLNTNFGGFSMYLDVGLSGHFLSPYEDRIAIVYYTEQQGYEGPPNVIRFALTGGYTLSGF